MNDCGRTFSDALADAESRRIGSQRNDFGLDDRDVILGNFNQVRHRFHTCETSGREARFGRLPILVYFGYYLHNASLVSGQSRLRKFLSCIVLNGVKAPISFLCCREVRYAIKAFHEVHAQS